MEKEKVRKVRKVRKTIKPLCKVFKIKYDYYIFMEGVEILYLNKQVIECTGDTVEQIRDKVIGYIFAEIYCKNNTIGAFQKQTLNVIKEDWIKQGGKI